MDKNENFHGLRAEFSLEHKKSLQRTRGIILSQVNATFLADALKPQAQPWLSLGEKLGKVAACLSQGKVAKATVTTYGADMKPAGRYITAAVSSGIMGNEANLVNSSVMAKEKGCQVSQINFKPFTPELSIVILLTVCHTILINDFGEFGIGSTNNLLIDISLYSCPLSA